MRQPPNKSLLSQYHHSSLHNHNHNIMNQSTKRSILRWIHLIVAIPILGYIYGPAPEVEQYATAARFVFVPIIMLSGYWMYAGASFAILGLRSCSLRFTYLDLGWRF